MYSSDQIFYHIWNILLPVKNRSAETAGMLTLFVDIIHYLVYNKRLISDDFRVNPQYKKRGYSNNLPTISTKLLHDKGFNNKFDFSLVNNIYKTNIPDSLKEFIVLVCDYFIENYRTIGVFKLRLELSQHYQQCFSSCYIKERVPKWYEFFREVEETEIFGCVHLNLETLAKEFQNETDLSIFKNKKFKETTKNNEVNKNKETVRRLLSFIREDANQQEALTAILKVKELMAKENKDFDKIILENFQ
jgi:hypothetical protein